MAGAFNGARQNALVLGTGSGFTTRANSSVLFYIALKQIHLFIVQRGDLL